MYYFNSGVKKGMVYINSMTKRSKEISCENVQNVRQKKKIQSFGRHVPIVRNVNGLIGDLEWKKTKLLIRNIEKQIGVLNIVERVRHVMPNLLEKGLRGSIVQQDVNYYITLLEKETDVGNGKGSLIPLDMEIQHVMKHLKKRECIE